jgi:conjugal transfer mating pair stabilization protein TraG
MYEIITYGGGNVLNGVFEAIARMRGAGQGASLFSGIIIIAVLCGYIRTILENINNTNIKASVMWAFGWSIFLSLMYVQTVRVVIIDRTLNQENQIANVPFGIALFASLSSQISDLLTKEFETQFSVPDDHRSYQKYGSLFSEALVTTASKFEIINPRIERNFRNFARQCVMYDVRIGNKYTLEDLMYADNIWELIMTRTSRLRMFDYFDGQQSLVKTCIEGAANLNDDLTAEAERNKQILAWRLFGKSNQEQGNDPFTARKTEMARNAIEGQLNTAHGFLTNMAGDASSILKQHMVRNAIKDSVIKNAQVVGASAAAQGFAIARAQEQQRNTFQILGDLSGKALANLTIVFQAILYGSFMLIILVVVQPNGFQFLKKYLGLVLWVQSWPPLFAIINYIQTEELRSASIAASTYIDGAGRVAVGWNLFTSPAIIQANLDIAAFAGFYSISVPLIAISLVQGVQSFLTLASHLGSVTQGSASHAAEEMTTGNYSYGNINLDNYSASNTNANHWNTAGSYTAMRSDWELASGSILSHMGDGSMALNQGMGSSQLMTSFRLSDMYSSSIQQQSQVAESALYNDSVAYSSSVMDTATKALQLAKSTGSNISEGTHYQHGEHASIADSINKQKAISQKIMQEYGVNEEQTAQLIATASLGIGKEIGGRGLPTGISDLALSALNMKANISGSVQGNALSNATAQEAVRRTQDLMVSENATHVVDDIIRAAKDGHFNVGNDKQSRLSEDFRSSFDEMNRQESNYQSSLQRVEGLQKTSNILQSSNANIEQNLQQYTFEKIADLKDSSGNRLGETRADEILKDPMIAKQYIDVIAEDSLKTLMNNYQESAFSSEDIARSHHANSTVVDAESKDLRNHNNLGYQEVIRNAKEVGLDKYEDTRIENKNQELSENLLQINKKTIDTQNSSIEGSEEKLKVGVNEKLNLHKRGLEKRAFSNSVKRILNLDDKK